MKSSSVSKPGWIKKNFLEIVRYGIAGVSTTLVNLGLFHGFVLLGVDYRVANFIAIIGGKTYGYFINKLFVFKKKNKEKRENVTEVFRYIVGRGLTGVIDFFGLIFAVEVLHFDKVISKYALQVVVIVLNYVLGKFYIFRKNEISGGDQKNVI